MTIEDSVDSEGEESTVVEIRRMMIRMFYEHKEILNRTYKNNSMDLKRTWI
jgi:hypothetical protein